MEMASIQLTYVARIWWLVEGRRGKVPGTSHLGEVGRYIHARFFHVSVKLEMRKKFLELQ